MNCERWRLSEVALPDLALVKERLRWIGGEDHCRWVFRVPRGARRTGARDLYLKVWNPAYIRRDHVLRALDAGFYDERTAPALHALVFHRGVCRGYVMERCRRSSRIDPAFWDAVKAATWRTGYFHVNFSRHHALRHKSWYSLIDLDAVYPISELVHMPLDPCAFDSPDYERFVCGLGAGAAGSRACRHAIAPSAAQRLRRVARLPVDKLRALVVTTRRAVVTRSATPGPHLQRIDRG
jgi:hypothetical protein